MQGKYHIYLLRFSYVYKLLKQKKNLFGIVIWVIAMTDKTILIADDEERIVMLIGDFLENAGYKTVRVFDGDKALTAAQKGGIDLCIADIMMPGLDGWALTREIRKFSNMPVIILSARSEEFDMLESFDSGACEYVTKLFSPAVLVKRVNALLSLGGMQGDDKIAEKGLKIDRDAYTVSVDGENVELTLKEFELLCTLFDNAGRVLSRDQLLNLVWGYDYYGDERTVDSHIARLRTKLGGFGAAHLKTVYGTGYKLEL